jgi:hypothetical protein
MLLAQSGSERNHFYDLRFMRSKKSLGYYQSFFLRFEDVLINSYYLHIYYTPFYYNYTNVVTLPIPHLFGQNMAYRAKKEPILGGRNI